MNMIDSLKQQFANETYMTRPHLERLPSDKFDWQPHQKSYTAGALASHIVECVRWATDVFTTPEFNFDPATYKPFAAKSSEELLKGYDEAVARSKEVLAGVDEESAKQKWALKVNGQALFERPRDEVFRDFTLSHMIHHRGQFSVYLRLLEIPVPSSYGPTADEKG
jgi:uncharacterized damage-inducible protein DinB